MEIIIILLLIILNGVFSMSEIALVSARKFKLETSAKRGSKNAQRALDLSKNPNTFLSTVQIGITLIGILTGLFSGEKLTTDLKAAIEQVVVLQPYAATLSVIIIVIIITFLTIVFGELIPKRIGLMYPEAVAAIMARPMMLISTITRPFIWLLSKTNDFFIRFLGLKGNKDGAVSEEEIKAIVQESAEGGLIQEIEQDIVHRVFALGDRKVSELMTHRSDLVCFNITDDLQTVKERAQTEAHSVYPVIKKTADNLIGIVSVKDIFPKDFRSADFNLGNFLKQPLMVPGNTPAYKILEDFRQSKIHYAFVVDEYGSVQGMVSMDDILDALIGDVTEYNHEEYQIVQKDESSWLVDGGYPFFEFLNYFNLKGDKVGPVEFNTLAGFILDQFHRIPKTGETVTWQDFEMQVVDMDGPRVDKILVTVKA